MHLKYLYYQAVFCEKLYSIFPFITLYLLQGTATFCRIKNVDFSPQNSILFVQNCLVLPWKFNPPDG